MSEKPQMQTTRRIFDTFKKKKKLRLQYAGICILCHKLLKRLKTELTNSFKNSFEMVDMNFLKFEPPVLMFFI